MRFRHLRLQIFFTGFLLCVGYYHGNAQGCPENIDFEDGNFKGWTCYIGSVEKLDNQNRINIYNSNGPVTERHTLFSANAGVDPYGGFPVNCPNGSGYSMRLGNDQAGTEAEGVSYEFTVPRNQNVYSLIYHYAVVFQDPNHQQYEQPRLEIEITNVTDNTILHCSSFTFIPYGSLLPGFFESPNPNGNTPVWCKDWTAVSINLNGNAGKVIRLSFKTADCTFRRHFGYAYVDVNSECSSEFSGAAFCPDDTAVNVTAPYGYMNYTWYNSSFTQVLGNQQKIIFRPVPTVGSTYPVILVPYDGYGCLDTLYAKMNDSLTVVSHAGKDTMSCNENPVPIGAIPKPGLVYNWTPATGLSDPNIANPVAAPEKTTTYILATRHDGGGCLDHDTVVVRSSIIDNALQLKGSELYCSDSGDSAILSVQRTDHIQWYKNDIRINGATAPEYRVSQSGAYSAKLLDNDGCAMTTVKQKIVIENPRPGITYPVEYAVLQKPLDLKARKFGVNVLWSPDTWLNSATSYNPIYKGTAEQQYTVQIKTVAGCVTVDTQMVKTVKDVEIYVPSAFTPNKDGMNDFLKPLLRGIKELRYFRVFNRWGNQIFEMRTGQPGWDGTLHGVLQPSQTFVWTMEGVGVDDQVYQRKGTAVLVR
jgi:gliding motility-associated-like protein